MRFFLKHGRNVESVKEKIEKGNDYNVMNLRHRKNEKTNKDSLGK